MTRQLIFGREPRTDNFSRQDGVARWADSQGTPEHSSAGGVSLLYLSTKVPRQLAEPHRDDSSYCVSTSRIEIMIHLFIFLHLLVLLFLLPIIWLYFYTKSLKGVETPKSGFLENDGF